MDDHWKTHDLMHPVNYSTDPMGLQNVCIPSEPIWLNEYHDKIQLKVFNRLMSEIDPDGYNIYDIGAGAGRWTKRLREKYNASVTGIDLQKNLARQNGLIHGSFMEYTPTFEMDLITSVTVLQHIPYSQQPDAFKKLNSVLGESGYLLMLENVSDISRTCFSRDAESWVNIAELHGFSLVKKIEYDSSPLLRLADKIPVIRRPLKRIAVELDHFLEPLDLFPRHCGFLFAKN